MKAIHLGNDEYLMASEIRSFHISQYKVYAYLHVVDTSGVSHPIFTPQELSTAEENLAACQQKLAELLTALDIEAIDP